MTAQLRCFGESGNAYKAALTLELSGYDWQPVYVDFFSGEARSPAFRAINAMGEVPVFREGDLTLSQSAVIQLHVAERTEQFLGSDRNETLRWLMFDNHKLSGQAGPARFLLNFLPVQTVDPFTGVIQTGYGIPPGGGRSYRATIKIADPALDARSLKVSLQGAGGAAVAPDTVGAVEDAILTRARQLRVRDGQL